jgi:hypothetical protein
MDQFEYVMVLVSIIVGLGIAHLLLGVGGIIDRLASRRAPLKLSIAYFAWLTEVFLWMVLFWWWEFRFGEFVGDWTIGLYFFLILYAVVLFLLSSVMVPRTWDQVDDLSEYFLERRIWFYSLNFVANTLDIADTYLKGGIERLLDTPTTTLFVWALIFVACAIGFRAKSIRPHAVLGVIVLGAQILSAFVVLPSLVS